MVKDQELSLIESGEKIKNSARNKTRVSENIAICYCIILFRCARIRENVVTSKQMHIYIAHVLKT